MGTYVGRPGMGHSRSRGARLNLWCDACQAFLLEGDPLSMPPEMAVQEAMRHQALWS